MKSPVWGRNIRASEWPTAPQIVEPPGPTFTVPGVGPRTQTLREAQALLDTALKDRPPGACTGPRPEVCYSSWDVPVFAWWRTDLCLFHRERRGSPSIGPVLSREHDPDLWAAALDEPLWVLGHADFDSIPQLRTHLSLKAFYGWDRLSPPFGYGTPQYLEGSGLGAIDEKTRDFDMVTSIELVRLRVGTRVHKTLFVKGQVDTVGRGGAEITKAVQHVLPQGANLAAFRFAFGRDPTLALAKQWIQGQQELSSCRAEVGGRENL